MKDLEKNKEIEEKFSQAKKLFQEHTAESIEAAISLFKEVAKLERDSKRWTYIPKIEEYLRKIKRIVEDYSKTGENYKRMGWSNEGDSYCKIAGRLTASSRELEIWISLPPRPKEEITPPKPRRKKAIPKPTPPGEEKPKKPTKAKEKRKSKHPGKKELEKLIMEHQANLGKLAKDLKVSETTVLRWINDDSELKQLTKVQRKARVKAKKRPRPKEPKKPKVATIQTIGELRDLMTSGEVKRISWAHLPKALHKALVRELARKKKKKLSELSQEDYKAPLTILNQQSMGGFYNYYRFGNSTGKITCRFILEELGLVKKVLSPKEVETKEKFKELLLQGIRVENWSQVNLEIHRSLVEELAQKTGKRIEDIVKGDYEKILLPSLNNGTLSGLYQHYDDVNKTTKRTAFFILEELGLVERTKELKEITELKELKKLLASKAILTIRWGEVTKELQRALIKELVQETKKTISQLNSQDFKVVPLDSLDGRALKDMYLHHKRLNKTGKPTTRYILEELGLVTEKAKALRDVRNTEELKELFDSEVIKQVSWSQLDTRVQVMLVSELAGAVEPKKRVEELTQNDYMKVSLSCLGGNTLGGLHLHYSKQNKTGRLTCRFILEKLGLVKVAKDIEEIKTKEELKELLISGAIRRIDWGRLDKKIQAALIRELAQKTKKTFSKLVQRDYCGVPLTTLNGRKLGGLYGHYRERNYTAKSTAYFILEELSLLKD